MRQCSSCKYKKSTKGIKDSINKEGTKYEKQTGIFDRLKLCQSPHSKANKSC